MKGLSLRARLSLALVALLGGGVGGASLALYASERVNVVDTGVWEIVPPPTFDFFREFKDLPYGDRGLPLDYGYKLFLREGEARTFSALSAKASLQVGAHLDFVFRRTPERSYVFRLGTSAEKPTGFYRFVGDRVERKETVDFRIADEAFHAVRVETEGARFRATVDGAEVARFEDDAYAEGGVGFAGPYQPTAFVREARAEGERFAVADAFTPPLPRPAVAALGGVLGALLALALSLASARAIARRLGVEAEAALRADVWTLLPLATLPGLTEETAGPRIGIALALAAALKVVGLLRLRRLQDAAGDYDLAPGVRGKVWAAVRARPARLAAPLLCSALFALAYAVYALEPRSAERAPLANAPYESAEERALAPGRNLLLEDQLWRNFRLTAEVRAEPGAVFEIFFRKQRKDIEVYGTTGLWNQSQYDWYALRLSPREAVPNGFAKSTEAALVDGGAFRFPPERWVPIALEMRGARATFSADGEEVFALRDSDFRLGSVGVVPTEGALALRGFRIAPLPATGDATREQAAIAGGIAAAALAPWLLWLGGAAALRALTRVRAERAVRFAAFALLPPLGAAVFAAGALFAERTAHLGLAVMLGAAAGAALLFLFLLWHHHHLRAPNATYLLCFVGMALLAEGAVRETIYGVKWKDDWAGGYQADNFLFWQLEPAGRVWESYINSLGFRGREVSIQKPPGTIRVLCLGGSSTYGDGVRETDKVYPGVLERLLRKRFPDRRIEVLNAGISGYTTYQALLYLKRDLLQLDPDVVTLYFAHNDGNNPTHYKTYKELHEIATRRSDWVRAVQRLLRRSRLYVGWSNLIGYVKREWIAGEDLARRVPSVPEEDFKENLREFVRLSRERGFELVFLPEVTAGLFSDPLPYKEYYDAMAEVGGAEGVPVVDTLGAFRARWEDGLLYDNVHPTEVGHRLLAERLYETLTEERGPLHAEGAAPAAEAGSAPEPGLDAAESYARQGLYEQALGEIKRLEAERPGEADLALRRGAYLEKLERWDEALAAYGSVEADEGRFAGAMLRGRLAALEADWDAARAAYEEARGAKPENADALSALGVALEKLGDAAGAEARYREALERDSAHAASLAALGALLEAKGDAGGAVAAYERLVAVDAAHLAGRDALGRLYRGAGDRERAAAQWRECVRLDPEGEIGRRAARHLEALSGALR